MKSVLSMVGFLVLSAAIEAMLTGDILPKCCSYLIATLASLKMNLQTKKGSR